MNASSQGSTQEKGLWVGVGVVALGIFGVLAYSLSGSSDVPETVAFNDDSETATEDVDETTTEVPVTEVDETASELAANQPDPNFVSVAVPLRDIVTPDRAASGTMTFDFNLSSGEVCYAISATGIDGPFRSHIHLGGSDESGGIVVDMGPQVSGAQGCVPSPPLETEAILAHPDTHYAELHDLSEEWTIRAQLSEGLNPTLAPDANFDANSDGAYLVVSGSSLTLEGSVASADVSDDLLVLYSDATAGLAVANATTITSGAADPSGRVVLADEAFNAGSATLPTLDESTLATLEALATAHSDWSLTANGRADSGSDSDQLALDRAAAILQVTDAVDLPQEVSTQGSGAATDQESFVEFLFLPAAG